MFQGAWRGIEPEATPSPIEVTNYANSKLHLPRTQTLWKKEIFPPNILVFSVTIRDPTHTITNT